MTNSETKQQVLLSDWDIAALNAARSVLSEIAERCRMHEISSEQNDWRLHFKYRSVGVLSGRAEDAEHALFMVLNSACSHSLVTMTDDQLHNRPEPPEKEA